MEAVSEDELKLPSGRIIDMSEASPAIAFELGALTGKLHTLEKELEQKNNLLKELLIILKDREQEVTIKIPDDIMQAPFPSCPSPSIKG